MFDRKVCVVVILVSVAFLANMVGGHLGRAVAQTKADALTQVANISPIRSVERSQCIGSGTGTNPNGTTYQWSCNGLQMFKITLDDGTVLGPYVGLPATAQQAADTKWQTMPLKAPDPGPSVITGKAVQMPVYKDLTGKN